MIRLPAIVWLLTALVFPGEPRAYDGSTYFPASPLQPVGVPRTTGATPNAAPSYVPYAAPAESAQVTTPSPAQPPAEPKLISCEDACSAPGFKAVFDFERGRIGLESRVDFDGVESFEIRAYSQQCPHAEGKQLTLAADSLPDSCLFVFAIPATRAVWTGARAKQTLRCTAGKIGMSGFHCNESTSPPGSITDESLTREP